jgi:DeoR family transcriptional regulator, suf operon transcriptional repressor
VPLNDSASPTRRTVVELLKWNGPMTAAALGDALGVSVVAVRRHVEALERDGFVRQATRASGRGRPAHVYDLTAAGHAQFPRNYDQLLHHLLRAAVDEFGPDAIERLFSHRQDSLFERYQQRTADLPLAELAQELAVIQDENGYMAECVAEADGSFVVREHNCAIPSVAGGHPAACRYELALLRRLAGPDLEVERVAHIGSGDHVCAYRLRAATDADPDA